VRGYAIEEELGSGAFGTVYRVRHLDRNVCCAMKQLSLRNVGLFGATAEEQAAEVLLYPCPASPKTRTPA